MKAVTIVLIDWLDHHTVAAVIMRRHGTRTDVFAAVKPVVGRTVEEVIAKVRREFPKAYLYMRVR